MPPVTGASAHLTNLDILVIATYFLVTIAGGLFFWRQSKSAAQYTTASHAIPVWICGLSILATYVSSISFLALPGKTFASNWSSFVYSLVLPIGTLLGTRWFIAFYRRAGVVSAYDHFELRFGTWARVYASSCFLIRQTARIGLIIYLTALPMRVLIGWDIRGIIVLIGCSVTLYAFTGGIKAVIWTDVLQTSLLLAGAIACLVILLIRIPVSPLEMLATARSAGKLSLGSFMGTPGEPGIWVIGAFSVFNTLQMLSIDQNYVQRYFVVKTDAEAKKSIWIGTLGYIPLSAIFFFIGTCLFYYYQADPTALPMEYQNVSKADSVLPYFIKTGLPTGVRGLLIAAIFAASMSAIASGLNAAATIFHTDFYKRFIDDSSTDTKVIQVLRISTLLYGFLVTGVALTMVHIASALDMSWTLASIFGGGVLGLFLLGLFDHRVGSKAALLGILAGLLSISWMTFSEHWTGRLAAWRYPFHSFTVIVTSTLVVVFVGLLAAALTRPRGKL
jgi:SSS family solute:Na+ symporter